MTTTTVVPAVAAIPIAEKIKIKEINTKVIKCPPSYSQTNESLKPPVW